MADILEDESSPAVSERVQLLAKSIYDELEVIINDYGPESIGNLMPLVVNILESLDSALSDNQDNLNAVMELTEENQQLVSNYEREKQHRKEIEEKAILMEEANEREIAGLKESNSTMLLENKSCVNKINNQLEQIEKLDERHEQLKREYKELHDKNLELVRNLHGKMESIRETGGFMTSSRHPEDMAVSVDVVRAPGFQDFTVSKQKKKRQQPTLPLKAREPLLSPEEENFIANTPAVYQVESPEIEPDVNPRSPPNLTKLGDEYEERLEENEEEESGDILQEEGFIDEDIPVNEQSLLAELGDMDTFAFTGLDDILLENKQLHSDKEELSSQLEALNRTVMDLDMQKNKLENEKDGLNRKLDDAFAEVKKLKKEAIENREELRQVSEKVVSSSGTEGLRISRLEIAKVLRERNEWKEKYFSLLEQVRMNDELYLFKKKDRKSRWVDYFTALFSSTRRRQLEQSLIESSPHRPILAPGASSVGDKDLVSHDSEDQVYSGAGYSKTKIIPTLKRVGKKEDEVYMTSVCWVIPNLPLSNTSPLDSPVSSTPVSPSINTCRPMSFQEEGAKILCSTAVNKASFLNDCSDALSIPKGSEFSAADESSISLVWICTGTDNLTKVSVLDTAAVGEVLETFAVCSTPIICIAAVPSFDDKDPDVLASLSTKTRKPVVQQPSQERPSSKNATVWMGSDSGVLYIHSAVSQWKRCIHADKLPAGIQDIIYSKGKVFVLLQNATVAVFVRFSDGDWDCDNYGIVTISQIKNLSVTTMVAVKYNIWCAIGNSIYVLHSHHLRNEANFTIHSSKQAEVNQMLSVGDGVWVAFRFDSILRLFHATSFTHMQDLDVAPSIQKILVFGSEKRSSLMPVPVSCIVAAQNSLWVGTENGIILSFPFTRPTIVAEESGWEVIKEAEVGGQTVPEPFDVRTEEALDASMSVDTQVKTVVSKNNGSPELKKMAPQPFNPFCNIDQVQLSIHCHVNAVSSLICVPGMIPKDITVFEPLGGVYVGPGEKADYKPTLFVMSCGEGHLDLRTADKVMQTVHAQEAGKSGIPTAASIISEKNYIMVWDIVV